MRQIKTVGVKALKDNLSAYLRDVRAGALILVTDRGSVVAELREPDIGNVALEESSLARHWIREGLLIPARTKKKKCMRSGMTLKAGASTRLLGLDRQE